MRSFDDDDPTVTFSLTAGSLVELIRRPILRELTPDITGTVLLGAVESQFTPFWFHSEVATGPQSESSLAPISRVTEAESCTTLSALTKSLNDSDVRRRSPAELQ